MSLVDNIKSGFERAAKEIGILKESAIVKDLGRPDINIKYDNLPTGTLYQDQFSNDGAVLWLKTGPGAKWKVVSGDTGWVRLKKHASLTTQSTIMIRRIGDIVFYSFGGGAWGWFGIVRRGGPGFAVQSTDRERNCFVLALNGIPQGFHSESGLIGNIYNDKGTQYGTWYLGGVSDSNTIRFQFINPIPTDRDIGDIRVSAINYPTNDAWPHLGNLRAQGFIY